MYMYIFITPVYTVYIILCTYRRLVDGMGEHHRPSFLWLSPDQTHGSNTYLPTPHSREVWQTFIFTFSVINVYGDCGYRCLFGVTLTCFVTVQSVERSLFISTCTDIRKFIINLSRFEFWMSQVHFMWRFSGESYFRRNWFRSFSVCSMLSHSYHRHASCRFYIFS